MTTMPTQKPGRSKQDYGTPLEFIAAVEERLQDVFVFDLAASRDNNIVYAYFTEKDDALAQDWHKASLWRGWLWLNPPYANIAPWVKKCWEESQKGAYIACLVPASVGANWWKDWVQHKAYVNYLNGRITFVGETTPYPKDCALLLYTPWGMSGGEVWTWNPSARKSNVPNVKDLGSLKTPNTDTPSSVPGVMEKERLSVDNAPEAR